jgi:glyceraldehyde-3-phosphate dehydrogenase (NAD(P))
MSNQKVRVAVNGYGVIGKRIADAVAAQDDMQLVGIADVVTDWRIKVAVEKGYAVFASTSEAADHMQSAAIPVAGDLTNLLSQVDVITDATPKKIASGNLERYHAAGVKSIFQGGEKHTLTGHSFVAQANYASALGLDTTRVVSCNTTSIVRTLGALKNAGLLKRARGVLIRRATDPWESDHTGVMNTVVPEKDIPSHQGPDAQTILPRAVTKDEILDVFRSAPRIAFLKMSEGVVALNSTLEMLADLGRPRGDMWEVGLWEDGLTVSGHEVFYNYQVYNQAIVVPETIDAIRALTGIEPDGMKSIAKTDQALGLVREFIS